MRILVLILSTTAALAQTLATFNLREAYGVPHAEQPIEFAFQGGYLAPSNHRVLGANGVEVPFQQLANGNILVRSNLPASTIGMTFTGTACNTGTGYLIINDMQSQYQIKAGMLFEFTAASPPGGFTSGNSYFVVSAPGNSTIQLSSTVGGSAISCASSGSGTFYYKTAGFVADAGADILTQAAHGYTNGDNWKCTTTGTAPGGLTCDGTTSFYVRDVTTNTYKLAATAGGAAVNITSAGTGIPQVVIDWTWTLETNHAPTAVVTNPVVSAVNGIL